MKPNIKIGSFLLAVLMIFTALLASGCVPISLNQEWSYKTADKELPIGVYIYSLDTAYNQALTFAKELDDYDGTKDTWLDMEITDDDGNTEVARTWIKEQAELMCLSYLVLDEQLKLEDVDVSDNLIASADEQAKTYWNVGQYADYGYIMPMSDDLEPYGISFDSFAYCSTEYSVRYQALFDKIYGEGGSKAVSDDELSEFFNENYVDYSYFSVNLYTSTTDEAGTSSNVALSDEDAEKLIDEIDGYAKDLNGGKSYEDVIEAYMTANDVATDPSTSNIENLENSSIGTELKDAIKELGNEKATTVKVGSGDSAVYYLVYKRDIKDSTDSYISDADKKASVLASMKSEEYADYVEGLTKELKYEANTSVLDQYDPKMFFIADETTTAASSEATDGE